MTQRADIIFWFRKDLRISDNEGLLEASLDGRQVMPIYIMDDQSADGFELGEAGRCWLHHSLCSLNKSLRGNLNCYMGDTIDILTKVITQHNIKAVYWNDCYEPWAIKLDKKVKALLDNKNIDYKTFRSNLLWEPSEILKPDNSPYRIYSHFYNKCCLIQPKKPLAEPKSLELMKDSEGDVSVDRLNLIPDKEWHKKILKFWQIGEQAAQKKLFDFVDHGLRGYKKNRDYPAKGATSKLSMHLSFGEISPNQIWYEARSVQSTLPEDSEIFFKELAWREFCYYLLYHFPDLPTENFQSKFDGFPWQNDEKLLDAWKRGKTGYPIVDAGMRELWQTGYMHNRVRMIVGSFLVKNLFIHWRFGERWFWDCLLDADLANNSGNWQWVAGTGADAAPYFRIFNPILQGEKFDPDGEYTCRFVPELKELPKKYLFKPWDAPEEVLNKAGVKLGNNYPLPIIDFATTRARALKAFKLL